MLNLHKIYLFVDVQNEKAVHIYKSQNFVIEGTLQEHFYTRGKYSNCHIMGLLKRIGLTLMKIVNHYQPMQL